LSPRVVAVLALLGLLSTSTSAVAHGADPIGVSITERASGEVRVAVDAPVSIAGAISVELPEGCAASSGVATRTAEARRRDELVYRCVGPLAGREVQIHGLTDSIDAILRVESSDGAVQRSIVRADAPRTTIQRRGSRLDALVAFGKLGVRHLWTGLDHLLFIAGLVLLARRRRAIVAALTAFTVGHSLTLAAAVTHVVKIPAPLAEVAIAASLVVLGVRVVQRSSAKDPPEATWRLALVAGAMGLLHGLGFASALEEVGIPEGEVPLSLLGFNVGIELGQLAVVAALVVVGWAASRAAPVLRRLGDRVPRGLTRREGARLVAGYAMGGCAAMWCIERVLTLVHPA